MAFKILITTVSYVVGGPGMSSTTALHSIVTQFNNLQDALTAIDIINAQQDNTLLLQKATPLFKERL